MASPLETSSPQIQREMRRRWLYLMPLVFVTYSLAYVDRVNYGLGAAAGLAETLHITGSQSAWLGALFFLGYFLFQVPGAAYARRRHARGIIFATLVSWGALASLTGVIGNFWLLALDRLLLGAAESFVLPGMLILLTHWFTKTERSRTNTLLILGNPVTVLWMSIVTGYLIQHVGWQRAFIYEGVPSVLWGFIWLAVVRDRPADASWMSVESCAQLEAELASEQKAIPRVASLWEALRHGSVAALCLQYFCWCVGLYGFVLWLPAVVQHGAARGIAATGLLTSVPYLAAIVLMLLASYGSDRSARRKQFVWPFLIVAGVALFGSYWVTGQSFWLAFAFLIVAGGAMYAPYGPFFAIIPEMLPANVAGEVTALVNSCGAFGSFVGTLAVGWLNERTHSPRAGFLLMSVALIVSGLIIVALRGPEGEQAASAEVHG